MQSILSTTPTDISKKELNNASNITDVGKSVDENEILVKDSLRFSNVLESFIDGETQQELDLQSSAMIESQSLLPEEALIHADNSLEPKNTGIENVTLENIDNKQVDLEIMNQDELNFDGTDSEMSNQENLSIEAMDLESNNQDELLFNNVDLKVPALAKEEVENLETDIFDLQEHEAFSLEDESLQKSPAPELFSTANGHINEESDVDVVLNDVTLKPASALDKSTKSPILAHIEMAETTDTKVTANRNGDKPEFIKMANANFTVNDSDVMLKESKKMSAEINKFTPLSAENIINNELEKSATDASLRQSHKLDNMFASLHQDPDKVSINNNQESNSLTSMGQTNSSSEKLLNKTMTNTTSLMQSTALQQPIELQEKNAAAVMGEKIMMMINQGKQEVTIRLDPAELGSLLIKLQMHQDQVQVAIQTQVSQSRDIIEQHLPRLREQLEQQGVSLGEATVEQQSKQQQSNSQNTHTETTTRQERGSEQNSFLEEQSDWISTKIPLSAQGIDFYA
ncbi:MAG: flagellar hook-length control protein FliK [Psychromonas sp.]